MNLFKTKKFRYGSISLALTVIIIAAVILVNAIFTALSQKFLWYIDMTEESIYSLSDGAKALLDEHYVPTGRKVEVIFCSDKDVLEANASQRYALYTVLELVKLYDNVSVRYVDWATNPSEVNKYKETSGQTINSSSIIITSGTESRVYPLSALFTYDSAGTSVIGYNGEQKLISGLLAVTRAESPIVCWTNNHGEMDALADDSSILTLLYETGYEVQEIDLTKEDIPADCRLLLVFDPQSDFRVKSTLSNISELDKIDKYLDECNNLMVFVDYDTPVLPNFEAFLEEWGIKIARSGEAPYLIKDTSTSLDTSGYNVKGQYTTVGLGSSITDQLRRDEYPKSVIFPMTTAFVNPEAYEELESEEGWSSTYFKNGVSRDSYDIFLSTSEAVALAGGETVSKAVNLPDKAFSYMKVVRETKMDGEASSTGQDATFANVIACASTQFASSAALDSGYGNHTVIAYACNILGRAVIAISLPCKYFVDTEISDIEAEEANQYTIVLTVVPAGVIFIAGMYVIIRRKYA